MWDLPGPGLELMSPALAGRFLTTVSPGKPSLVKFIPWYFILFDAIVNGITFLFSLSDSSLLVYRNTIGFCILISYPTILLKSVISSNRFSVCLFCCCCCFQCMSSFFTPLFFFPWCHGHNSESHHLTPLILLSRYKARDSHPSSIIYHSVTWGTILKLSDSSSLFVKLPNKDLGQVVEPLCA